MGDFVTILKWLGIVVVVLVVLSMLAAFLVGMFRGMMHPEAAEGQASPPAARERPAYKLERSSGAGEHAPEEARDRSAA